MRTLVLPVIALSVCTLLSGCGADTATPETRADSSAAPETSSASPDPRSATSDAKPAAAATASATIGGREFTFELDGCLVYDGRETEIDGLGRETGSTTPSYLDGGSTQMGAPALGEFRINIGAQGQFESSDDFVALGAIFDEEFSIVPDGDGYLVSGRAWDSNATDLGPGTLRFTCG